MLRFEFEEPKGPKGLFDTLETRDRSMRIGIKLDQQYKYSNRISLTKEFINCINIHKSRATCFDSC